MKSEIGANPVGALNNKFRPRITSLIFYLFCLFLGIKDISYIRKSLQTMRGNPVQQNDFSCIYASGLASEAGLNPYDMTVLQSFQQQLPRFQKPGEISPFIYPPANLYLTRWLTRFSYAQAFGICYLILVAFHFISAFLFMRIASAGSPNPKAGLIYLLSPLHWSNLDGCQANIIILFCLISGLWIVQKRSFAAGFFGMFIIAIPASIKIFPLAAPLIYLFLNKFRFSTFSGFAFACGVFLGLNLSCSEANLSDFRQLISGSQSYYAELFNSLPAWIGGNVSINGLLSGIIHRYGLLSEMPARQIIGSVCIVLSFFYLMILLIRFYAVHFKNRSIPQTELFLIIFSGILIYQICTPLAFQTQLVLIFPLLIFSIFHVAENFSLQELIPLSLFVLFLAGIHHNLSNLLTNSGWLAGTSLTGAFPTLVIVYLYIFWMKLFLKAEIQQRPLPAL